MSLDICDPILCIYNNFPQLLKSNLLQSQWSCNGVGWQELWFESDYAGFYASCEGLLSLNINGNIDDFYIDHVFKNHILAILDDSLILQDNSLKHIRSVSRSTTTKICHFLDISHHICDSNSLYRYYHKLLIDFYNAYSGFVPFVLDNDLNSDLLASSEVSITLYSIDPSFNVKSSIDLFTQYLDLYKNSNNNPNIDNSILALYTLSKIDPCCIVVNKNTIVNTLTFLLSSISHYPLYSTMGSRFYNTISHSYDYYSTNLILSYIETILIYYLNNIINSDYINAIIPILIEYINNATCNNGVLVNPKLSNKVYFWENAHFYRILSLLLIVDSNDSHVIGGNTMLIQPQHFHDSNFVVDNNLVVVLMPFREKWSDDIYNIYSEVVDSTGLTAWRSDNEFGDDNIMQTIWSQINQAKMIIADCTGQNPNVFYELGIAHTLGKKVFICAQSTSDIPFDLNSIRYFLYDMLPSKLDIFKSSLERFIRNL